MVQFLLGNKNLKLNDCLYHVIKSNEISYVKLILEPKGKYEKEIMFRECKGSLHFPGYLTPLMLASHCGHFEIMQYLIKENHPPIPVPHEPKCVCKKCVTELREMDPLEWAAKKLDTFRALTSPYYIMLDSEDPIFTVFLRVEEIKLWKNACWEFRRGFEELMKDTETFAADLVSLCRTGREVITLLSEKEGCDWIGEDFKFPRLLMAVDKKQHLFVAQTNVQAVLEDAWVGNWYMWKTCADSKCLLFFFGRIFTLPLVCLLCLVPALNSKWSNFYDIPVNRMITSVASYLVFLFLLYLASDRDKTGQTRYEIQNHTLWQVIIFFFVVAHICSSFRLWTVQGTRRFFSFMWNTYDLFTQLMFAMTFAFWMCALLTLETMPDLERKYWHYLDPQLLAEGLFCIGTVLAYLRLLLLVQMHHTLGPMQISMGKMTKDFSKFIIIFGIVVVSFNVAMSRLYEYYDGMKQIDPKTGAESVQESSFVSFQDTFKVLFWGLFTMSSQEAADVVIENLPDVGEHLGSVNSHDLTQAVGYGLFGVYEVLTVIVIMNMLIAAMSNTYQNVTDNVDVQWIFGRTEVYMIYMSQTAVPPPFSIVPAVGKIFYVYYQRLFSKQSPTSIKQPEDEENHKGIVDESYNDLMKKLVKRYLNLKNNAAITRKNYLERNSQVKGDSSKFMS
ncbi:short transient receptor potential channel 5-like [Macrosteles quadrilineatus]|uniref:short transient receptor potential channel 5-like n=1 Tax=Macrosteles quadrilineatus TaxID=74068 RepID=UPI0023E1D63C|nr:short transient receptor potential channel 5-like [Macrosteles quadrilineatus]